MNNYYTVTLATFTEVLMCGTDEKDAMQNAVAAAYAGAREANKATIGFRIEATKAEPRGRW